MAKPSRDKPFEARVIADSIRYSLEISSSRNNVGLSTVSKYRKAMHQDLELKTLVQEILAVHTQEWEPELYQSIRVTFERLNLEPDIDQRHSLLEQLEKLMEIHFAKEQWGHVLKTAANGLYDAEQKSKADQLNN